MDRGIPIKPEFAELTAQTIDDACNAALDPSDEAAADSIAERDRSVVYALEGESGEVRRKLFHTGIDGAIIAFAAMRDGIAALKHDVIRDPAPIWSPVTLTRAFMESVVMMRYIVDPTIGTNRRIARIAGLLVTEDDNAHALARTFDPHAESNRAKTIGEMRRGGIRVEGSRSGTKITVEQVTIKADFVKTDEARKLLPPDAPEPYRLFSGPAHARPWGLIRTATRGDNTEFVAEAATLEAVVHVVLYALEALVTDWYAYFGYDSSSALTRLKVIRKGFAEATFSIYSPMMPDAAE
jgi:hypothetical protein